jgi:hypothetical protein
MNYKTISSKEGLEYLEKSNKSLQDVSEYSIPSQYGVVYQMSNGEIVLINPKGKGDYPGFVFDNYEAFIQCCDADFFPIEEEYMTWLERHANQMKEFLKDDRFYLQPLAELLKINDPFKSVKDCELAYGKLVIYITNKKNSYNNKQASMHCYAAAVSKFLIEEKGYRWTLKKGYEIYNPYYYPQLHNDSDDYINVFSKIYVAIGGQYKASFREFYWYVTGIPIHVNIN